MPNLTPSPASKIDSLQRDAQNPDNPASRKRVKPQSQSHSRRAATPAQRVDTDLLDPELDPERNQHQLDERA